MHYRKLLPSNYIGSWDLDGKEQTLTIDRIERRDVFVPESGKEEPKVIISFKEARKHWVANRTNLDRIASIHGPETDNWVGKKITIMPTKVKAFGKMVDAVRVKYDDKPLKGVQK